MSRERRRRQQERSQAAGLPRYAGDVIAAVEKAMAEGRLQPGLCEVTVRHDAWCDLLAGKGPCNCEPEVCPPERIPSPQDN